MVDFTLHTIKDTFTSFIKSIKLSQKSLEKFNFENISCGETKCRKDYILNTGSHGHFKLKYGHC